MPTTVLTTSRHQVFHRTDAAPQHQWEESRPSTTTASHREGWLARVRTAVYRYKDVEDLYVSVGQDPVVDYWIVIPKRDISLVRRLMDAQQKYIIPLFTSGEEAPFQLDFHIVYREGRDISILVPTDAIHVPRY